MMKIENNRLEIWRIAWSGENRNVGLEMDVVTLDRQGNCTKKIELL